MKAHASAVHVVFAAAVALTALPRAAHAAPDLPPPISELVQARYPDAVQDAGARARMSDLFGRSNAAFEAAWRQYTARKAEVTTTLEQARALADKDPTGAAKLLAGVVHEVSFAENGSTVTRQFVDAADAELDAVTELARLASASKDYELFIRAARGLSTRRKVGSDKDAERLMWFAYRNAKSFQNLSAGVDQAHARAVEAVIEKAQSAAPQAFAAAAGLWGARGSYGLSTIAQGESAKKTKPAWVAMRRAFALKEREARFALHMKYSVPYNCADTGKVDGIDPLTGKVTYVQRCSFRSERVDEEVAAALAETAPAWAAEQSEVWVIGRVTSAAPAWKLVDAVVPDLRFLNGGTYSTWVAPEAELVTSGGVVKLIKRGEPVE